MLIDGIVGDARPASQLRARVRSRRPTFFGPIVRPFVGPGYWAPMREGDYAQVNVPSWADGGEPAAHGRVRRLRAESTTARSSPTCTWTASSRASVPWQSATVFDLPEGESEWRVVNTAVHDGSYLPASTKTVTEWTFRSSGTVADYTPQTLPMMQAYYDVEADAAGAVGAGRKAGKPVELGLELEPHRGRRSAWPSSPTRRSRCASPAANGGRSSSRRMPRPTRPAVEPDAQLPGRAPASSRRTPRSSRCPTRARWIDLRVTATDAAGNTFSQEIERAFEAAPSKKGGSRRSARRSPVTAGRR